MNKRKSASEVFGDTAKDGAEASGAVLGRPWSVPAEVERDSRSREPALARKEPTPKVTSTSPSTVAAHEPPQRPDLSERRAAPVADTATAPATSAPASTPDPEAPDRPFGPPAGAAATKPPPAKHARRRKTSRAGTPTRKPSPAKAPPRKPTLPKTSKPPKKSATKATRKPRPPGRPASVVPCLPRREVRIPEVIFQRLEAVSTQTGLQPMDALWMLAHLGWRQWNRDERTNDQERPLSEHRRP